MTMRPNASGRHAYRRLPVVAVILAACAALFLLLPVVAVAARAPWLDLPRLIAAPASREALWLSVQAAAWTTAVSVLVGVPLALVLARCQFPGRSLVRTLVFLPVVMPPVVSGLALLAALGRRGMFGGLLAAVGIDIAFTTTAVVIAHTFVAMPFLVLSVEGSLRAAGTRGEAVAATLGASPLRTLWTVTLPQATPAIGAGALLACARSLAEFGATLTFAGSLQGVTRTMPIEIYLQREVDPAAAIALSVLLIAVAAIVVTAVHGAGGTRGLRASLPTLGRAGVA